MDYKETLNLPKTDFPMKANLVKKEPEMIDRWEKQKLYERIRETSKAGKNIPFTTALHMPTATSTWARLSTRF